MDKTLIIGASGKIGRIVVSQLLQSNHSVVAMVRDKGKCLFGKEVEVVEGDLEDNFKSAIHGCNRVVFSAGSGANTGLDKTLLVDLWGARSAIDAAKQAGVQQFIMVSSRGADNPDDGPVAIKAYLVAKHFADEYLMRSGLRYTILRPGRLTDDVGTGLIKTIRPGDPNAQVISREDTASVISFCLKNEVALGKTYELYRGPDSIANAIA